MNFRDMTPEQYTTILSQYEENLNEVLNKAPQPIENEEQYNAALWDKLMLEEADDFFTDFINRPVYKALTQHITNWESK